MKKRKLKRKVIPLLLLIPVIIIGIFLVLYITRPTSINEGALKYKKNSCIIFYPNVEDIKEYAIEYCDNSIEDEIVDYGVKQYGDYIGIEYSDKTFVLNKDYSKINLEINDKKMFSEIFRYEYKKSENDEAYTTKFLIDSYYENIDISNVSEDFYSDSVVFYMNDYDFSFEIPYSLAQQILNADFGFENETYVKKHYVSKNRPIVVMTYDDGPYRYVDKELYSLYDLYDSRCTFYSVGNRIGEKELESIGLGISMGFEFGSHSYAHGNYKKMSSLDALEDMMFTVNLLKENFNYDTRTYRPPYGSRNIAMEMCTDMDCVLWTVDTEDWKYRDEEIVYKNIMSDTKDKSIVLMHSLYESTLNACIKAVPDLIDGGYQLVTISEYLDY